MIELGCFWLGWFVGCGDWEVVWCGVSVCEYVVG